MSNVLPICSLFNNLNILSNNSACCSLVASNPLIVLIILSFSALKSVYSFNNLFRCCLLHSCKSILSFMWSGKAFTKCLTIPLAHASFPPCAVNSLNAFNISGIGIAWNANICFLRSPTGKWSANSLFIISILSKSFVDSSKSSLAIFVAVAYITALASLP